jgi:Fur family transcriptional regulator, ferric uptake regulator
LRLVGKNAPTEHDFTFLLDALDIKKANFVACLVCLTIGLSAPVPTFSHTHFEQCLARLASHGRVSKASFLPYSLLRDNRRMERETRQRTAIREALSLAARPLSPQEILGQAQSQVPALSLATVYRNIKAMLDDNEIGTVNLPGDSPRYELSHHHHHHHFQCTRCECVFDIPECPGDMRGLAPKGFRVERHELTLYGQCKSCASPESVKVRKASH